MHILDRSQWGAASAKRQTPHPMTSKGQPVTEVYLHHSVTPAGPFGSRLRSIQRSHLNHPTVPYVDVAYNAAVSNLEPFAANLRGPTIQGGATRGKNATSLSICAVGDFDTPGKDEPSALLMANIAGLLRTWIDDGHVAPWFQLRPHSAVAATACCGRRLRPLIPQIMEAVRTGAAMQPESGVTDRVKEALDLMQRAGVLLEEALG